MGSVGVSREANVDAIIDDQRGPIQGHSTQLSRTAKKTPRLLRLGFIPKLNQRCASTDQLFRITVYPRYRIPLGHQAGEVDDGIERGQSPHYCFAASASSISFSKSSTGRAPITRFPSVAP